MVVGLATEFRSEKFRGKDSEQFPLFRLESIPKIGTEQNCMKKISFTKNPATANRIESVFPSAKCFGTKFLEFFCSTERYSESFSLLWNGSVGDLANKMSEQPRML